MSFAPWDLELKRAKARPRLFWLNVGIPLLLVAPVALGGAPPPHAAAVYAVLFVLFGVFGSAVPMVRDAESGLLGRLALTGASPGGLILQRSLAATLLDGLQLLPSALVISAAGEDLRTLILVLPTLVLGLLVANLWGVWVAALARSVAETALFAAVSGLLLLHFSGVFRTPSPGSLQAAAEAASPFASLNEILLAAEAGSSVPAPGRYLALGAWALGALLLTWALAPLLLGTLQGARRGR